MKKNITQADIAKIANVTRQTVSLVLNNDPRVNSDTRKKILEIIEQLDYHPNIAARNLAKQKSKCIGYHFFNLEKETFTQPLFTDSLAGIYFRANELGYTMKLYRLDASGDISTSYKSGEIDGAIFVTYDNPLVENELKNYLNQGFPTILIGNHPDFPYIDIDHISGSKEAVTHLLEKGKKEIAYLGGGLDFQSNKQKYQAYQETLRIYNINENPDIVKHHLYTEKHGYDEIKKLLEKKYQIDAVFSAVNDLVAIGAQRAIFEFGLKIPDDVSIIGYDASVYSQFSKPLLTGVKSPFYELGRKSVEMIVEFIETNKKPDSTSLVPKLIINESA